MTRLHSTPARRRKRYEYDTSRSPNSNSASDWRQENRDQRNCTEQSAGRQQAAEHSRQQIVNSSRRTSFDSSSWRQVRGHVWQHQVSRIARPAGAEGRATRHSRTRMVAPSCSPGDRAFLSPSPADQGVVRTRLGRQASADLTPASRRQDYTTSPSAKAPFVCAPGDRSRKSALRSPHARGRCRVHRIPLRVRDDRETHLVGRKTARVLELIWVKRKQEYFRARTH
jgi:hypothetical protein